MSRYDLAPAQGDDGVPCPTCGGSGTQRIQTAMADCFSIRCPDCSGSGYGPPPPEMDRLRSHCMRRLAEWAHRNLPPPEEEEV